jgi:Penicillin-insensitive murein endopeptidase
VRGVLLRLLLIALLAAAASIGAARVVSVARADIELARPGGASPVVGRDGELLFRLRFADRDVEATIDGSAVPMRLRGELLRLDPGRLRGGAHTAVVRARTPGPLSRTVVRQVGFRVDAHPPPLRVEVPRGVRTPSVVVRGRTDPTGSVTVRAARRARRTRPEPDGRFAATLALPAETTALRVIARDRAGNRKVAVRRVVYDTSAPRLRLRVPAVWLSPSRGLSVRVRDATPVRLSHAVDGQRGAAPRLSDQAERVLDTGTLTAGRHRLELRAVDAAGNAEVLERVVTVVSTETIRWRRSRAIGTPAAGRLHAGVRLPVAGYDFFTWNPVRDRRPNPAGRRWGTDRLVRTVLRVLRGHRHANPGAPRVGVGDLSPRRGGRFANGVHLSHQNGLDVDIYYPRKDRSPRAPAGLDQVNRTLAQDLVDRFVAAGAQYIFVDNGLRLSGPPAVVQHWPNHEDHLHVRLPGR